MANMGFGYATHITQKCSESVNSFGFSVFVFCAFGFWLSNGVPKSKNEFAQPDLECTTGSASWSRNFEKSKFSLKVEDLGRFRALNRSGVLAGANFIACGAAARLRAGAAAAPE